ncbi:PHP domain-containing protein [Candidatus Methylocalor cossyra]|uniref:3',5'-nucleoside bisphosphate phosphatase n=1 Tax=Candidatus Methylocalor cossyra TaxID=3108543 RepID=A0ABP1C923_9GAMM
MYDLHTHSTASDGAYAPTDLVTRAAAAGITTLALSDHDSTAGLAEAQGAARAAGIRLIPAVEISATWRGHTVHIVGLHIAPDSGPLKQGLAHLRAVRQERAREMGRRLERKLIPGLFEAVSASAGDGMITRTHFARQLAALGLAGDARDAFERYLARGKPGYVPTEWAEPAEAIGWIRTAGGTAVLAHPQRYRLSGGQLRRLVGEFQEMGGAALEVVSGNGALGDTQASAECARRFGLLASCGSDFHGPDGGWPKLGRLPPLPADLTPVWSLWSPHPLPRQRASGS